MSLMFSLLYTEQFYCLAYHPVLGLEYFCEGTQCCSISLFYFLLSLFTSVKLITSDGSHLSFQYKNVTLLKCQGT
jgi:hypothetical protein